jgi:hypothetical protein
MKTLNLTFTLIIILTFAFTSNASTFNTLNTNQTKIKVTTVRVTDIKSTQAKCSFTIQGSPINEKGVCFSDVPSPTISGKKSMAPGNPTNNGTSIMSGLKANTKYFVRAYAKSGSEVFYGNEMSFTTLSSESDSKPATAPKKESKPETPNK